MLLTWLEGTWYGETDLPRQTLSVIGYLLSVEYLLSHLEMCTSRCSACCLTWGDTNLLCTPKQHLGLTGSNIYFLQEWWNSIISNYKSQFCSLFVSPINSTATHRLTCDGKFHLVDVPLVGRFQTPSHDIFLCPSQSERFLFSQISRTRDRSALTFCILIEKKLYPGFQGN